MQKMLVSAAAAAAAASGGGQRRAADQLVKPQAGYCLGCGSEVPNKYSRARENNAERLHQDADASCLRAGPPADEGIIPLPKCTQTGCDTLRWKFGIKKQSFQRLNAWKLERRR